MRSTKQYGLVNSWQEHQMLVKAEHTYQQRQNSHDTKQLQKSGLKKLIRHVDKNNRNEF